MPTWENKEKASTYAKRYYQENKQTICERNSKRKKFGYALKVGDKIVVFRHKNDIQIKRVALKDAVGPNFILATQSTNLASILTNNQ